MKYLLLTTLLLLSVNGKKKKQSCEWSDRPGVYLKSYDRKTKAYPSVERAKEACEKDSECGAVGLDMVPYRKNSGGAVVHEHTIYLLPGQGPEFMLQGRLNHRFKSFVKGDCKKGKKDKKKDKKDKKKDKKDKKKNKKGKKRVNRQ